MLVVYCRLCRHCRNLARGGCLLSRIHCTRCCYFLSHVPCRNLPWQGLVEACEWAEIFVRDELKYNPTSNLQLLLVIHMWLVKPWTTILTSTPKGYHRSLRDASMNIKSYLLLYQIGKRSWLTILFLYVSLNNTVNSLQKLSLPYKELLF